MNMHITPPQKRAIEGGQAVDVVVDQIECVIIRKDVYDRVKQPIYDDSEWTEGEQQAMAAHSANAAENPRAQDELRDLEARLERLLSENPVGSKGFTKAGVRKMIARLHEELALFEGSEAARHPETT